MGQAPFKGEPEIGNRNVTILLGKRAGHRENCEIEPVEANFKAETSLFQVR